MCIIEPSSQTETTSHLVDTGPGWEAWKKRRGNAMKKEITINEDQMKLILTVLDIQHQGEAYYHDIDNKAMKFFCSGQADGIKFVLDTLGIEY